MDLKFATNTTLLKIKSYILKISTDIYIIPFTQFTIYILLSMSSSAAPFLSYLKN